MLNGGYNATEDVFYVPAILVTYNEVICPLPSQESYLVSVTNDNSTLSEPALLTVYDKQCHECTKSGTCRFKVGAFFIHISFFCRIQYTIQRLQLFLLDFYRSKNVLLRMCVMILELWIHPTPPYSVTPMRILRSGASKEVKAVKKMIFWLLISEIKVSKLVIWFLITCINSADNGHI